MTGTGGRIVAMLNSPHLGALRRESMEELGWNTSETSAGLGCARVALSRLLNGKSRTSTNMLLVVEALGWGSADHWMAQGSYERLRTTLAACAKRRRRAETPGPRAVPRSGRVSASSLYSAHCSVGSLLARLP